MRPLKKDQLTEQDIKTIIKLYIKGWSQSCIGRLFNKDHSTIFYHLQRVGITEGMRGKKRVRKEYIRKPRKKFKRNIAIEKEYQKNKNKKVKTYQEYLDDEKQRNKEDAIEKALSAKRSLTRKNF
ncbi:MAG: helix-turn-helix domain-containing protein [Patescibacteria group bacterium]|nr:helix-turn-helix domain-containing protein [Patescibacteria group bacterium]